MLKDMLRHAVPVGLLEALRAKRAFEKIHFAGGNPWRAACSRSLRQKLQGSRLEFFPPEVLLNPKCIVDVGAHIGKWSEAALEILKPEKLYAIEPAPESFKQLQSRIGESSKATLVQAAVGAKQGTATFHIMNDALWNSFHPVRDDIAVYYPNVEERNSITVDVISLDDLLKDISEITLLKIDVQGGEWAVLDGARETMKRTKALLLEVNFVSHYDGDTLFVDLHERMTKEFGYELFRYAEPYYQNGKLLYADAVYTNPNISPKPTY